jgi:Type II secretion system (T2SS), protein E, N-terminal domain
MSDRVKIGEMLVGLGACPPEAVLEALHNQSFFGGRLGTNLLQMGAVDERSLADALRRLHHVAGVSGDGLALEPRAVSLLPRLFVERHDVVPYTFQRSALRLIMRDPSDLGVVDEVAFATGKKVEPVVAPEARVWALMERHYGIRRGLRCIGDDLRRWAPRLHGSRHLVGPLADELW